MHQHPSTKTRKTPVFSALKPLFDSAISGDEHSLETWMFSGAWCLEFGALTRNVSTENSEEPERVADRLGEGLAVTHSKGR